MKTDSTRNTIVINGREYDRDTGLLIGSVADEKIHASKERLRQPAASAVNIHSNLQRSQTLRRQSVTPPRQITRAQARTASARPRPQISRSPMISRFADITPPQQPAQSNAHSVKVTVQPKQPADRPFKPTHPLNQKVAQRHNVEVQPKPAPLASQPSSVIKEAVINQALEQAGPAQPTTRRHRPKRTKQAPKRSMRAFSLASASLAVVMLGGYFSYLAMPNLSVRVAAVQSGVNASYPAYKPNGYSLDGPVAYKDGQVSMNFKANGGIAGYKLTQANSNWDSSAVESHFVQPVAGENYTTTKKSGLTIYTYEDGSAAWVNKGILHSIKGDAPLSSDQVARIATSM